MKKIIALLCLIFLSAAGMSAQSNPYLDKKKKHRPSAVMSRQNKKDLKRQKRMAKKQMRRSKKHINRKKR
jgi:hypothetical protein